SHPWTLTLPFCWPSISSIRGAEIRFSRTSQKRSRSSLRLLERPSRQRSSHSSAARLGSPPRDERSRCACAETLQTTRSATLRATTDVVRMGPPKKCEFANAKRKRGRLASSAARPAAGPARISKVLDTAWRSMVGFSGGRYIPADFPSTTCLERSHAEPTSRPQSHYRPQPGPVGRSGRATSPRRHALCPGQRWHYPPQGFLRFDFRR